MVNKVAVPTMPMQHPGVGGLSPEDARRGVMMTEMDYGRALAVMDERDEEQIRQEIAGSFTDAFVWDIPFASKKPNACRCDAYKDRDGNVIPHEHARGPSIVAVREMRQAMGRIQGKTSAPEFIVSNGEAFWRCECVATDMVTGVSQNRWYMQRAKRRGGEQDPQAFMICQSKAERDSTLAVLPQDFKRACVDAYLAQGDIKAIAAAFRAKELPAGVPSAPKRQLPVGGGASAPSAGKSTTAVVVGFGKSKGKRPDELSDKELEWYTSAYANNVGDPEKARYRESDQRVLDGLKAEFAARFPVVDDAVNEEPAPDESVDQTDQNIRALLEQKDLTDQQGDELAQKLYGADNIESLTPADKMRFIDFLKKSK